MGASGLFNLYISSWLRNCEADVAVEDAGFASLLAAQYELDLQNATCAAVAVAAVVWPASIGWPFGALAGWMALSLGVRGWRGRRKGKRDH